VTAGPRLESLSGREQLLAKTKWQYPRRTKVWLYIIEPYLLDRPLAAGLGVAGPMGQWAFVVAADWLTATHELHNDSR
jgi:hypothetical protein